MTCPNCGQQNEGERQLCSNCGAEPQTPNDEPSIDWRMVLLGCVVGIVALPVLWLIAASPYLLHLSRHDTVHVQAAVSVAELIGLALAFVYLFSAGAAYRHSRLTRGFLLGATFVMLGGMTLCDARFVWPLLQQG